VFDLKRPEAFLYLVFSRNPRPGLVAGRLHFLFAAGLLGRPFWLLASGVRSEHWLALQLLALGTTREVAAGHRRGYQAR